MSEASVSTTSSRIRQFGLYRTIDARTEEFLRLSRKRQLKQGCACAAVSTVITVTIVVSVILIYEYGIISEFSTKSTLRPNWLGLMNTSEAMPFEAKFNKASINLESSIPLLPLVLRALKKNRYYDNIMEDASSPNPLYENKETDELLTKNFFSDTRNWMRIPPSRIYAIEYKTSPIVYYKNPIRNVDYFTKIRRIRDYQRIMNYVDKMISDKITGSTMPMLKSNYAFDKNLPIPYTTHMSSIKYKTKHNLQSNPNEKISTKNPKCKCPKKMNALLNKMIILLHKLLPNATQNILKMPKPCDHNHKKNTNDVTESSQTSTRHHNKSEIILKTLENSNALSESKNTFEETLPAVPKGKFRLSAFLLKSVPPKIDYTLQTIIKLIRPKLNRGKTMINDLKLHKSKTIKPFWESTEDYYYSSEDKTKSLTTSETTSNVPPETETSEISSNVPPETETSERSSNVPPGTETSEISSNVPPEPVTPNVTNINVSKSFVNTKDLDIMSNIETTLPLFKEETQDNYLDRNKTPKIKNSFDSLDVHSLDLVKSKMIPYKKGLNTKGGRFRNNKKSELSCHNNNKMFKNSSLVLGFLRKMGQLLKSKSIISESKTEKPLHNTIYKDGMTNITYKKMEYIHSVNSIPPYSQTIEYFTTPVYKTRKNNVRKSEEDLMLKLDDLTLEDEEDKSSYEEIMSSSKIKELEKIINLYNNTETDRKNTFIKTSSYQKERINYDENKSVEETTKYIFKTRSSYLEIHRNDWKRDKHEDYEDTINNY